MERFDVVLGWLQQEGIKAKLEKCSFRQEVSYLGHSIFKDGVSADPGKTEVLKWQRPSQVSELCSFLGFVNYYRCFIEESAKLADLFHRLFAELTDAK